MFSAHNEGKSVVSEKFIKTWTVKIYIKMIANGRRSYISYLNKLVDRYNIAYYNAID